MLTVLLLELVEVLSVEVGCSVLAKVFSADDQSRHFNQIHVMSNVPGRIRMRLPGLKNSTCSALKVERILRAQPWVEEATANPATGTLLVRYNDTGVSPRIIEQVAHLALTGMLYESEHSAGFAGQNRILATSPAKSLSLASAA